MALFFNPSTLWHYLRLSQYFSINETSASSCLKFICLPQIMSDHEHHEYFRAHSYKSCMYCQVVMDENLLLYRKILVFKPQISETNTRIVQHVGPDCFFDPRYPVELLKTVSLFFLSPATLSHYSNKYGV